MRFDKFIAKTLEIPRSQARKLITQKRILLNGMICGNSSCQVTESDKVEFEGKLLGLTGKRYILLHKPPGYICSTQTENYPSALNLLIQIPLTGLHFAGRLDVDTTGLVLISDDGQWTHKITSPRKRCHKRYYVKTATEISLSQQQRLTAGVVLKDDPKPTGGAHIDVLGDKEAFITISEGRYHQVKRMFAAVGNHVELLHREQIGEITLTGLNQGEWRMLTSSEIESF